MTSQYKIVIPLGLEAFARQELEQKVPAAKLVSETEGLLKIELEDSHLLTLLSLKSPSRLYQTVASFKARDFPKLFQKLQKINWGHWLTSQPGKITASTQESRLLNSSRIEDTTQKAIAAYFKAQPASKKWQQKAQALNPIHLKIRVVSDEVEVDVDLAGELFFKRGQKIHAGKAPLRENLAALLLQIIVEKNTGKELELVDPMAGSGTILLEALHFSTAVISAQWSLWGMKRFEKVKPPHQVPHDSSPFRELCAFEMSSEQFKCLSKNLQAYQSHVQLEHGDALKIKRAVKKDPARALVALVNPPYNLRLKGKSPIKLMKELMAVAFSNWQCDQVYFLLPKQFDKDLSQALTDQFQHQILGSFNHGGLRVSFHACRLT